MILINEALQIIEKQVRRISVKTVDLAEILNRVLAEDVFADMDLPPFDRSQMDGFAVRMKDVISSSQKNPVKLKIIGESSAGNGFDGKVNRSEAVRIMTGARLPKGADAVQKVELTDEKDGFVAILEAVKEQQNINRRGAEIKKGARIFEAGEIITENMAAPLAAFGYARVKVYKKPKVAILATGSEIVDLTATPQKDQIRNSNSIAIKFLAEKCAAETEILPLVRDDIENLKTTIQNAAKTCDVLIISGGVSVGDYDFTKPALKELGAEIFFERVSLRPGKPTVFAKLDDTFVFGLPGNPVSVAVTFHLFVRNLILRMSGAKNPELRKNFAVLSAKIKGVKERDSFLPALVEINSKGKLVVESLRFSGSSNFIEFSRANALVFVPQNKTLEAGEIAEIVFL